MGRLVELSGRKFGRLTVISLEPQRSKNGKSVWKCICECGVEISVISNSLLTGNTTSCGCYKDEIHTTHGQCKGYKVTSEYNAWVDAIKRCTKSYHKSYHRYGGRGISVCDRWLKSFDAFMEDMGPKPGKEFSLDRIENDGNYEPSNCRWGTDEVQQRNKSTNMWLEYGGKNMIAADWAKFIGTRRSTLSALLKKMSLSDVMKKYGKSID